MTTDQRADCYLSNFADMRKRAGRVSKYGGSSGYWAAEVLTLLDLFRSLGIDPDDPPASLPTEPGDNR